MNFQKLDKANELVTAISILTGQLQKWENSTSLWKGIISLEPGCNTEAQPPPGTFQKLRNASIKYYKGEIKRLEQEFSKL